MPWVQDSGRKASAPGFPQQILFDGCFPATILAKGFRRLILPRGRLHTGAMHPNRAAMQEMTHVSTQRIYKLPRTLERIAGQVDDCIWARVEDTPAKQTGFFFGHPVQGELFHMAPS